MLEIADDFFILGCTYEKLGYSLLHPQIMIISKSKSFCNGKKRENKIYKLLQIPIHCYGRRNRFLPTIESKCHMKISDILFFTELDYTFHSDYLIAEVNVKDLSRVVIERIWWMVFENRKYRVNSAFAQLLRRKSSKIFDVSIYND